MSCTVTKLGKLQKKKKERKICWSTLLYHAFTGQVRVRSSNVGTGFTSRVESTIWQVTKVQIVLCTVLVKTFSVLARDNLRWYKLELRTAYSFISGKGMVMLMLQLLG